MKFIPLLFLIVGCAHAVSVDDVKVSQATNASPPAYADRFITPVASSLQGFDSSKRPINVVLGNGLSFTGNTLNVFGSSGINISLPIAANTFANGITLTNPNTASSLNEMFSPSVEMTGKSWSGSASVPIKYRFTVISFFGSQAKWVLQHSDDNGGNWTDVFSAYGATNIVEVGTLNATSEIAAPLIDANSLILRDQSPVTFFNASQGIGRFVLDTTINGSSTSGLTLNMQSGARTLTMPGDATISGTNTGDAIANHTPANSSEAGTPGTLTYDSSFLYVWTGPTTVKRIALSSF